MDGAAFARDHARDGAPADQAVGTLRGERGIGRGAVLPFVHHDMRAHQAVAAQVDLVRRGDDAARRDRHHALGRHARRQDLVQARLGRVRHVIDTDDRRAFGQQEHHRHTVHHGEFHAFGLHALGVGPTVRVVAGLDHGVLEGHAGFVDHRPVLAEDRPAAAAAVHVAFVGHRKVVGVDPLQRVGFAQHARGRVHRQDRGLFVGQVHAHQVHRARAEMARDGAVARDHRDVVVFLQGHGHLARGADVHELGLRVLGRHACDPGQVGLHAAVADGTSVRDVEHHHETGGHLRHPTVARVLVALVLDGDGNEAAVGRDGGRIGLPAQIAFAEQRLRRQVIGAQRARGIGEGFRRVDRDERRVAQHRHGGGRGAEVDVAKGRRGGGVGDVDDPQHAERAVGVGELHPVARCRDDLGRAFAGPVLALAHVVRRGERRDAVEVLGRRGARGQRQHGCGQQQVFHGNSPRVNPGDRVPCRRYRGMTEP